MKNKKLFYSVLFLIVIFFVLLYVFSRADKAEQKDIDKTSQTEIKQNTNQDQNEEITNKSDKESGGGTLLSGELNSNVIVNENPAAANENAKAVSKNTKPVVATVTPTVTQAVTTVTPVVTIGISQQQLETIVLENKSTGAQPGNGIDKEEKEIWTEIWNLRDASPIETDSFQLSFNYKSRLFDVVLKNDNSQEQFYSWLIENGYREIPASYFVYIVK